MLPPISHVCRACTRGVISRLRVRPRMTPAKGPLAGNLVAGLGRSLSPLRQPC